MEMKTKCQFSSKTWKKVPKESQIHRSNLVLLDNQLIKKNRTLSIDKMISTIIL